MTRSPSDVATQAFPIVRRGYDPVLVRAFLTELADELAAARADELAGGAGSSGPAEAAPARHGDAQQALDAASELLAVAARRERRAAEREADLERGMRIGSRFQREREAEADLILAGAEASAAAIVRAAHVEAARAAHARWDELNRAIVAILERARLEAEAMLAQARDSAHQIQREVLGELVGWSPPSDGGPGSGPA